MDAEEIASSIQGKLFQTVQLPRSSQDCSIFRVPNILRRHNEKAFVPKVVSIGPFHHENTQLQAMGDTKLWYLKCFLYRTQTTELERLVKAIESIELDCRVCYAEVVHLSGEKFIEMMLIDGCFILEFLFRYAQKETIIHEGGDDPVFKTYSWMPRKIIADLLLLENQLPWYVLDCLFNFMFSSETIIHRRHVLDELVSSSFSEYKMFPELGGILCPEKHTHLLDYFRNSLLVGSCTVKRWPSYSPHLEWEPIMPVTELILHGIPLKAEYGENILDVKFEEGIMKIPAILIKENTESVFRNLIAFEHCDPSKGYEITSYAALFGWLIKSPADALKLEQKGILRIIGLSNEDRASFLNRLLYNNDTSFRGFLYSDLRQDVNNICSSRRRHWMTILRRDYFGEPWAIITFLFGIVFSLGLSMIQTVFAILSYKDSNSKSAK